MLGKLIKYDLKASAKIFIFIHVIYLVICLASRFLFMDHLDFDGDPDLLLAQIIIFSTAVMLLLVAANSGTWLLFTFRFYRNLFSKEGYLTWTLPVSGVQHLWAKIIFGYILYAIDTLVIAAGFVILLTGRNVTDAYATVADKLTAEFGMPLSLFAAYLLICSLVSGIYAVITSYFCIAAGQLFPSHRVVGAVAVYFLTNFCVQMLSMFILGLSGHFTDSPFIVSSGEEGATVATYLFRGLAPTIFMSLVIAAVQYAVTHYIMKKKINLL